MERIVVLYYFQIGGSRHAEERCRMILWQLVVNSWNEKRAVGAMPDA